MKRLLYAFASIVVGGLILHDLGADGFRSRQGAAAQPAPRDATALAPRTAAALPVRVPLPEAAADPFLAPAPAGAPARAGRAAPLAAPPLPYRFVGRVYRDGAILVYVARGARLLEIRQGDVLDDEYRVEALSTSEIAFVHLASGSRQVITLGPPIESAARPAGWVDALTQGPAGEGAR